MTANTVFNHLWLTLGAIARKHRLGQQGAVDGQGYAARLAAAEAEALLLTKEEKMHIALVGFDFAFATLVVAPALTAREWYWKYLTLIALSVGPLATVALGAKVVERARAGVLRVQRLNSVAFAGSALRSSISILAFQFVVLFRFIGFVFDYPIGCFRGDCDFVPNMDVETNNSWAYSAPISSCSEGVFPDEPYPVPSKTTVYSLYYGLNCEHILAVPRLAHSFVP